MRLAMVQDMLTLAANSVQHDTQQVIRIKQDFPNVRVVIHGGHSTPFVSSHPTLLSHLAVVSI